MAASVGGGGGGGGGGGRGVREAVNGVHEWRRFLGLGSWFLPRTVRTLENKEKNIYARLINFFFFVFFCVCLCV